MAVACTILIAVSGGLIVVFGFWDEGIGLVGPFGALSAPFVLLELLREVEISPIVVILLDCFTGVSGRVSDDDVHFLGLDYVFLYDVIGRMVVINKAGRLCFVLPVVETDLACACSLHFFVPETHAHFADLRGFAGVGVMHAVNVGLLGSEVGLAVVERRRGPVCVDG